LGKGITPTNTNWCHSNFNFWCNEHLEGFRWLGRGDLGFTNALLVRDPDGHVMELIEKR